MRDHGRAGLRFAGLREIFAFRAAWASFAVQESVSHGI